MFKESTWIKVKDLLKRLKEETDDSLCSIEVFGDMSGNVNAYFTAGYRDFADEGDLLVIVEEMNEALDEQKDTRIKELEGKLIRLQKITKIKQEFIDGYVRDKKELEGLLETAYRLGKTVARCDGVEEYNKLMIGDTLEEKIKNWKSNGRHDNR